MGASEEDGMCAEASWTVSENSASPEKPRRRQSWTTKRCRPLRTASKRCSMVKTTADPRPECIHYVLRLFSCCNALIREVKLAMQAVFVREWILPGTCISRIATGTRGWPLSVGHRMSTRGLPENRQAVSRTKPISQASCGRLVRNFRSTSDASGPAFLDCSRISSIVRSPTDRQILGAQDRLVAPKQNVSNNH